MPAAVLPGASPEGEDGGPVLSFAAEPGGAPPPVLRHGASGDWAYRPAGGDPMLVLRRRLDVLTALTDPRFAMAGVTASGEVRGCPLTGAEMQSPDGGLLNMNPPQLREYRHRINPLFTSAAAKTTQPAVRQIAGNLAASLAGDRTVDVLTRFAEPFTAGAVCTAMGIPPWDWPQILDWSQVAFAVVPSPEAVGDVADAWEALYGYYGPAVAHARQRPGGALTAQLSAALDGYSVPQVTHTVATVSNGFGAILPVLAVALCELLAQPRVVSACVRGQSPWSAVVGGLLSFQVMFPVALPRITLEDVRLGDRWIAGGTTVLPSLYAAANDPAAGSPPAGIAFGAGPHFCPGAALTRVWLAEALAGFFGRFPQARLAGPLEWQPGTLPVPRSIPVELAP